MHICIYIKKTKKKENSLFVFLSRIRTLFQTQVIWRYNMHNNGKLLWVHTTAKHKQ